MKYVHVASKPSKTPCDLNPAIVNQNKLCLYSLIEGFRQADFNTDTLADALDSIDKYREHYVTPVDGIILLDSGGYSVITGEVHPSAAFRLVQCYNLVLSRHVTDNTRIFSLDLPWSTVFHIMNTRATILELNDYAFATAKEILIANPEVKERYYFVWHSKMQRQYDVWSSLFDKHDLNKIIKRRAIGGLVGLRGITKIPFSPFIGIAYRCLLDYLDAEDFSVDFSIHYLGCYLTQDRFVMALLDALFSRYLDGVSGVFTSYDSINFSHTARLKKNLSLYNLEGSELVRYSNVAEVPRSLLIFLYGEGQILQFIDDEINRRKHGQLLSMAGSFAPLNIYSNRQIDLYFERFIADNELADLFFKHTSLTAINYFARMILDNATRAAPWIFTPHVVRCAIDSIEKIYRFHSWFIISRKRDKLEEEMSSFIKAIGFPGDLED